MQLVHTSKISYAMDSRSISLVLRVVYLLEKGGGISHLGKLIMKAPRSKAVGMEEFLDDISQLNTTYSYAFPWKLKNLTLIKR